MKIEIPNNNINERKYIIDMLLGEFLGLKYSIDTTNTDNFYKISFEESSIIIEDHFFSKFPKGDYLKNEAIPNKIRKTKNPFCTEDDLIILFGNEQFKQEEKSKTIRLGADIFAASFFMLTRLEEYVNKARDEHDRFPAKESLAVKNRFINRPIVDEYTEMIWNMLVFFGIKQRRKEQKYNIIPTHDIDHLTKYNNYIRTMGGDLLVRKSLNAFFRTGKNLLAARNPHDSFDLIMNLSEKAGLQSHFYFMSASTNQQYDYEDYMTHDLFLSKIKEIKERGHIIGFHAGYDTYNNSDLFRDEKSKLEKAIGDSVTEGRQHYLRFEAPQTWNIWDENEFTLDSTMYYSDKEGFRCGVCKDFKIFDVLAKRQLKLIERPMIIMEGTFLYHKKISVSEIMKKSLDLAQKVKKYNGNLVLLWHNSSFYNYPYNQIREVYHKLLETI